MFHFTKAVRHRIHIINESTNTWFIYNFKELNCKSKINIYPEKVKIFITLLKSQTNVNHLKIQCIKKDLPDFYPQQYALQDIEEVT